MGTGDVIRQCVAKGLREPEFVQEEEFRVTLWRNTGSLIEEVGGETACKILQAIEKNPGITRKELMGVVGLSIRGIEWNLAQLKAKGIIERVGATKWGYWKVNRK